MKKRGKRNWFKCVCGHRIPETGEEGPFECPTCGKAWMRQARKGTDGRRLRGDLISSAVEERTLIPAATGIVRTVSVRTSRGNMTKALYADGHERLTVSRRRG